MTPDELQELCLALPQAEESFPFSEGLSVFKTTGNGKIFALTNLHEDPLTLSLKCDPEEIIALREQFPQIVPGYHLNKKHWITVTISDTPDGRLDDELIEQLIHGSHALVRPRVPRGTRSAGERD